MGGAAQNVRETFTSSAAATNIAGRRPIFNSFFLATVATLIGIVFGIVVSYLLVRKRGAVSYLLNILVMLPLAIAGTVQGIALAATYNKGVIVLRGPG